MDYLQFKTWFGAQHASLSLPADCTELDPPKAMPTSSLVWTFRWYLGFSDGKYIQIKEHYTKLAGIHDSHRTAFVFHYGAVVGRTADGLPKAEPNNPVDIRIDRGNSPVHLHYGAPDPHYDQLRIKGLDMQRLDMFTFVQAVFRHRKSGKTLQQTLHFKIV